MTTDKRIEKWEDWVRTLAHSDNPRDVELLIAKIHVLLTSFAAEVRREERERIMQLFSHTEYIKRNDLVDALHPSDPTV